LGAGQASALPPVQIDSSPGFLLVQAVKPGEQSGSEQQAQQKQQAPFAKFNDLLEDTQSELDKVFSATPIVAEQRKQIEALKQETERLAGELEQANTRRTELESSRKVAEERIAELSKAIDVAVNKTVRLDEELAGVRRQNADLEQRLARAETARETAQVEAEKTRTELQAKLEAATDAAEQSTAELAEGRKELERTGQELAAAGRMRQQVAARAREMEQALKSSGAEAERVRAELAEMKQQLGQAASVALEAERAREAASSEADQLRGEAERVKAELAEMKQQLGQAASAAVEAERAREAASSEADQLRGEAGRAREELAAAKGEIARFRTANAELEKQLASLHAESESTIETARQKLTVMKEKIKELHAALAGAGLVQRTRTAGAQKKPDSVPDEASAQQTAPGPAENETPEQKTEGPARLAVIGPATAPAPDEGGGLERFDANIRYLNSRALELKGANLFSGVKSAGNGVVHVSTTPAWQSIPAEGQRSYLNSLFDLWTVSHEGSGPEVVRIVDANGQVLLEKSGTAQDASAD
jgi:chromosome segregation ATPase